jgi:hypothetical protein
VLRGATLVVRNRPRCLEFNSLPQTQVHHQSIYCHVHTTQGQLTTVKPTSDLRPVPKDEATGPNVWAHDCTHRIVNKERLPNSQPDRHSPLGEEILTLFCFVGVRSVKRAIRSLGVSQRRAETQGSVSLYHRRREPIMFTQCSYSAALIGCQN